MPGRLAFDDFVLDAEQRTLTRGGVRVDLNGRYLDALALFVAEAGRLVTKERLLDEVWRGVPVTDEALTQAVRTIRRALGDEAGRPRFIETVPKHGYRFIAVVDAGVPARPAVRRGTLREAAAGTIGAAIAGVIGGVAYGAVAASQAGGMGASVLLVLLWATILVAAVGGAGVSAGMALGAARWGAGGRIAGAAAGGLAVGGVAHLLGIDAFQILLGRAPGAITGAGEGLVLGAAVGAGVVAGEAWGRTRWRAALLAGAVGAGGGALVTLMGGRLMGGSLAQLAGAFPGSRLRIDAIGALLGEAGFGPVAGALTAALEGFVFAAGIALALRAVSGSRA